MANRHQRDAIRPRNIFYPWSQPSFRDQLARWTRIMTKLRIVIVDDEILARERLRLLLGRNGAVEIIGECSNGIEALEVVARDHPDIVFLDVQMPGLSGFEVVERLSSNDRPEIIFVTAHDRFAVEAFAMQAIDYLLKPFDEHRLQQALTRAVDHITNRRSAELGRRLETLLTVPKARPDRLAVRTDGRVVFVNQSEILWIEAANNYCILHLLEARRLMLRETLSSVQERLGSDNFARVNRSALVRVDQVKELQPVAYGDYVAILRDGTRLPLSRSLRGRLETIEPEKL
jgi:two-component system LytT family response regulator